MATIKFYTRSTGNKLATVYIRFTDGRKTDLRLPTPFRIFPAYWNTEKQTLKQRSTYTENFSAADANEIEKRIQECKDHILKEHFKLTASPNKQWLEKVIHGYYFKAEPTNETLKQYIKRFVEEAGNGKRLATVGTTKRKYTYNSIRTFRGLELSFQMFCDDKKREYSFQDINIDFYNDFIQFFYGRNCGANYVGRHIKTLKTIMRIARDEGLHNNMEIERRAFKVLKEPVDSIYLTEDEVKAIYGLKMAKKPHLDLIRDVFLCGVYTAQRYSDYSKIKKSNIRSIGDVKYIEIIQQKTREKCIIPIRPELDAILQKYDYTLPRTHEQKVNTGIKDIGFMAGIREPIEVEKNQGGMIVKSTVKKCDLIRTHTARRTGCTLMFLAGVPTISIMKISGHKTEKEFLKYIKVSKVETAINLSLHPYFSNLKVVV